MRAGRLCCGLAIIAVLTWFGFWPSLNAGPAQGPTTRAGQKTDNGADTFQLMGTSSCSARGCHGVVEPVGTRAKNNPVLQDEYSKWLSQDPHTNAVAVLHNERSMRIAANMGIERPYEEERCLACHTNPWAAKPLPKDPTRAQLVREERHFGVGCEACHGAAKDWLGPHTEDPWKKLDPKEKLKKGMIPTSDFAAVTQRCAGCHVGAAPGVEGVERDVNHDLIGAGHPRLNFEMGAFLANLPPHWNPKAKSEKDANDAQHWAIGQLVCAEEALKLLGHRAGSEKAPYNAPYDIRPWPEFAELDCYSCHHALKVDTYRFTREPGGRTRGMPIWGSWYYAMPRRLAVSLDKPDPLTKLEGLMQKRMPDRNDVKSAAADAAKVLKELRETMAPLSEMQVKRFLASLQTGDKPYVENWDVAEQMYQATWALNQILNDKAIAKTLLDPKLIEMRAQQPDRYCTPAHFAPKAFGELLSAGLKHLK